MDELRVEATGETVGEAKWSALRELERLEPELDKTGVRFEVLSQGERGLLGVGYAPARVLAIAAPPATPPPAAAAAEMSPAAAHVRELLGRIADGIGIRCRIELDEQDGTIVASCSGGELGMLIGRHGQTIDAIQYLVNAIVARRAGERVDVIVDAAGYRARREATLTALALRSAERVTADGGSVELEPMTAVERKIVHTRLQDYPGVVTASEGTEPNRYVVIRKGE